MRISDWSSDVCSSDLLAAAVCADRRTQRLRGVERDRVERGIILLAPRAGLEPDLGDAERARDQSLLDADVLDAVERDGAVLAREDAAFDHHLVVADEEAEAQPLEPGDEQRDQQEGANRGHDPDPVRSEEHTSELQSLMRISYAVFCLKKTKNTKTQKKEQTKN